MQSQGPGSPSKPHCNIFPTTPAPTSSLSPLTCYPACGPLPSANSLCVYLHNVFLSHVVGQQAPDKGTLRKEMPLPQAERPP